MILQRLPIAISALVAVALAAAIYLQVKPVFEPQKTEYNTPHTPKRIQSPNKTQRNIASFNLFGNAAKKPKSTKPVQKELPVTNLRLTLTGVVSSKDGNSASALIEGPDRKTLYYKVGDELPGNATLKHIYADRVVVERSGRLENLYFPKTSSPRIASANNAPPEQVTETLPQETPISIPQRTIDSMNDARKQSIKDRLSNLRKRISGKKQ